MKLSIGQVLHEPSNRHHFGWREYTVEKIGRKWAALSDGSRCTLDTLRRDCGGYAPRQLYVEREAYEQDQALRSAWAQFTRDVEKARTPPAGMTPEIIAQARALLGIEAKP